MSCRGNPLRTDKVINIAAVPHRSPFRYPGGKTWLVPHIRQWMKSLAGKPREFAEPFSGGGIVGLSVLFEDLAEHLVMVELDEDVSSVWQAILNGSARKLAAKITSFDVTLESVTRVLSAEPSSTLERAFATIVRNRVQRGGIMAAGASLMKKGENGRGLKSRWYAETLRKRIEAIAETSDRISFIRGDGIEFLRYNAYRTSCVFFIDPPYTIAGRRLYKHSELNHEELFRVVADVRGDFLLTYDNTQEIRDLAKKFGFDTQTVAMKNTHHQVMRELLVGRCLDWARKSGRPQDVRESSPQTSLASAAGRR